jgi:adenylate cyclase
VNVAARIESTTKELGVDLLVSEEVANVARGAALLEAGEILLKGKSRPTRLFALVGDETVSGTAEFAELSRQHGRLVQSLAARDAGEAAAALAACRAIAPDTLSGLYDRFHDRIGELTAAAPQKRAQAQAG